MENVEIPLYDKIEEWIHDDTSSIDKTRQQLERENRKQTGEGMRSSRRERQTNRERERHHTVCMQFVRLQAEQGEKI